MPSSIKVIAISCFSFLLVLALLEAVFAWAGVGEQEILQVDKLCGFAHFTDKPVTWRKEGLSRLTLNDNGMQDEPVSIEKPASVYRIAVLGDSFVESLQVERSHNFMKRWEQSLNSRGTSKIQVLNFGVSNYHLGQSYLQLKERVLQFKPDLVVIGLRPDGVFGLKLDHPPKGFFDARPYVKLVEGKIEIDRAAQGQWLSSPEAFKMSLCAPFRQYSRVWGVFGSSVESFYTWLAGGSFWGSGEATPKVDPFSRVESPAQRLARLEQFWTYKSAEKEKGTRENWPTEEKLLLEINQVCEQHSCRLALLRFSAYDGWTNEEESKLLAAFAEQYSIPYVDVTGLIRERFRTNPSAQLFYQTHMNPNGHQLVADALLKLRPYIDSARQTNLAGD